VLVVLHLAPTLMLLQTTLPGVHVLAPMAAFMTMLLAVLLWVSAHAVPVFQL
jgi:hypothetical protein